MEPRPCFFALRDLTSLFVFFCFFLDPSPLTSPLKADRKRSHKLQEYRSKGPISSADLDYKER